MRMTRLGFLDSLRGIAALYVVVFHMALVPTTKPPVPAWLHSLVMFGGSGVTLFFVLSAFSLCHTLRRHESTGRPWLSYSVSRLFRIAPFFYLMMAVTYVRDIITFGVWHGSVEIFLSATFLMNFFPGFEQGFVWASWTIGVEMAFYAIFPLLAHVVRDNARVTVLFCALLLAWIVFTGITGILIDDTTIRGQYQNFSVFKYLPVFLTGMIAYRVQQSAAFAARAPRMGAPLVALGLLVLGAVVAGRAASIPLFDVAHTIALGYALLLLGLAAAHNRFFDNGPLRFLGQISFSIYLLHAPIVYMLSPFYGWADALALPSSLRFGLCLMGTLGATLPLAYTTYRFVELPGIALGRRLLQRVIVHPGRQ